MSKPVTVNDFRNTAKRRLPKFVFDFVDGGAGDETTMQANRDAFDKVTIYPHHMVDVSVRSIDTKVLGEQLDLPVILAPTGLQRLVRGKADLQAAMAAGRSGTVYTASSASAFTVEEIADVAEGPLWFQLYLWRDRAVVEAVVERARVAGYTTLMITIDVPLVGIRERDIRNGMSLPSDHASQRLRRGSPPPLGQGARLRSRDHFQELQGLGARREGYGVDGVHQLRADQSGFDLGRAQATARPLAGKDGDQGCPHRPRCPQSG